MKKLNTILVLALGMIFSLNSFATVDVYNKNVYIVTENYTEAGYDLTKVPASYCVGIEGLTLASAITQEVKIKTNYGCGGVTHEDQINAATCADIQAEEVWNDKGLIREHIKISINLAACGAKAKENGFKRTLRKAILKTYNASGYQIIQMTEI